MMVRNRNKGGSNDVYHSVSAGLRDIYKNKLLPLEKEYFFHDFHSPALDDPDFEAKPMVMLVGQYSTGKTTFIRYILEQDFPGIRIGPEPTTDGLVKLLELMRNNALFIEYEETLVSGTCDIRA